MSGCLSQVKERWVIDGEEMDGEGLRGEVDNFSMVMICCAPWIFGRIICLDDDERENCERVIRRLLGRYQSDAVIGGKAGAGHFSESHWESLDLSLYWSIERFCEMSVRLVVQTRSWYEKLGYSSCSTGSSFRRCFRSHFLRFV